MKPENVDVARKQDYEIRIVTHREARELITKYHYAQGCSHTAVATHGLFTKGRLVGAALYLPPTKKAAQSVDVIQWRDVLSLSRLVVEPGQPKNTTGLFLGASLRLLRNSNKRWIWAVTWADEGYRGHVGTIYQATNWQFISSRTSAPRWVNDAGMLVATQATKTRNQQQMLELGYHKVPGGLIHKYVYRLQKDRIKYFSVPNGNFIKVYGTPMEYS